MLVYDPELYNRTGVFQDRWHAGRMLSEMLAAEFSRIDFAVVAIPAGGVPVGVTISESLKTELKVMIVSKMLFPWTTEAGFGAMSVFGDVQLNENAVRYFGLDEESINIQMKLTEEKIKKRARLIPDRFLDFEGYKKGVLVDDGLASGYTMLVAIESAKRFFEEIYVAVPTASRSAIDLIENECDGVFCLNLKDFYPFAVAEAYVEWYDISEKEMVDLLKNHLEGKIKDNGPY
jgi:predicted phosphoribosyltransferase